MARDADTTSRVRALSAAPAVEQAVAALDDATESVRRHIERWRTSHPRTPGSRVLLVEDDHIVARAMAQSLRRLSLTVDIAPSVESAMLRFRSFPYDLVIVDVALTGRSSGVELCDIVRRETRVPVVLMSGIVDQDQLADVAGECGANAWMQKPIPPERLTRVVRKFLGLPAASQGEPT